MESVSCMSSILAGDSGLQAHPRIFNKLRAISSYLTGSRDADHIVKLLIAFVSSSFWLLF
jgi:hypothetical protein